MTRDELPVYVAIYRVEQTIEQRRAAGEDLPSFGSDEWLIDPDRRAQLLAMIQAELLPVGSRGNAGEIERGTADVLLGVAAAAGGVRFVRRDIPAA